jgi:hypothetical protein
MDGVHNGDAETREKWRKSVARTLTGGNNGDADDTRDTAVQVLCGVADVGLDTGTERS